MADLAFGVEHATVIEQALHAAFAAAPCVWGFDPVALSLPPVLEGLLWNIVRAIKGHFLLFLCLFSGGARGSTTKMAF